MKSYAGIIGIFFNLFLSWNAGAQDLESADHAAPAPAEASARESEEKKAVDYASILAGWEKSSGQVEAMIPRTWLFLQEQGGAYGAPSPLSIDRISFEGYGWFELADPESIRLFIQINPTQKKASVKEEELPLRLKRYAELSHAEGVILKTSSASSAWAIYSSNNGFSQAVLTYEKGPESMRQDLPARWLVQQLGYDAFVVGKTEDFLVLAKLKPLKRGAQGLVLKKSAEGLASDNEREIGALLRVVFENDKYALAKVSLAKTSRSKIARGSKILFDQP